MAERFSREGMMLLSLLLLLIPTLASCGANGVKGSGGTRLLTTAEMDNITAASAGAAIDLAAHALGPGANIAVSVVSQAISGNAPIAGPPFLNYLSANYATLQGTAIAAGGQLADTNGSSHISVAGASAGAWIDAAGSSTAAGGVTGQAQLAMQFYGFSVGGWDIVLGNAIAC